MDLRRPGRKLFCVLMLAMLSACGGGGGGSGQGGSSSNPVTPAAVPGATVSPGTLTAVQYPGEITSVTVAITFTPSLSNFPAALQLVDNSGTWGSNATLGVDKSGQVVMTVATQTSLASGHYHGNVGLNACVDSACIQSYPGFPMLIPYDVTVVPTTNLTALKPLAGAADWAMYRGNDAQTGFVPATLDPSVFSLRWRWYGPGTQAATGFGSTTQANSAPVTSNGMLFVGHGKANGVNNAAATLFALSENDGSTAWSGSLGNAQTGNYPAISGARVFMQSTGSNGLPLMWSAAASTGSQVAQTQFGYANTGEAVPMAHGGQVFLNDSTDFAIFNGSTGNLVRQETPTFGGQSDDGMPLAFDSRYGFLMSIQALDILDGTTAVQDDTIPSGCTLFGGDFGMETVAANDTLITYSNCTRTLTSFNVGALTKNWSVPLSESGLFSTGNGLLYILQASNLVALNLADGSTAWTIPISLDANQNNDTSISGASTSTMDMIATNNLVFVSTTQAVYAIDQTSRQVVWSYNRGGYLALSANGILYVSTLVDSSVTPFGGNADGVTAFNLH